MNWRRWVCVLILAAGLFFGGSASAQKMAPQRIHVLTLLGQPLQITVANNQRLFAKYGLAVDTENNPNSNTLRDKLGEGQGDIAYAAVDNAVAMVELAHKDVIIVMGGEGSQNELIAQPEIKSVKDLKGKILIVDAVNTAYALQMIKILSLNGLRQNRDYELKAYGVTPQRLIGMREHKEFAGSMLGPPASLVAKSEGFVSLGSVPKLIGPYQAAGFWTQRAWARAHRKELVKFLAACIEAQRWLMNPANRQAVTELLIQQMHLKPELAAETYEMSMTQPGGYEKDARLDLNGFENVLKLRAEVERQWGGHPPAPQKYYDAEYYRAALEKVEEK